MSSLFGLGPRLTLALVAVATAHTATTAHAGYRVENVPRLVSVQISTECSVQIPKKHVFRPLAENRRMDPWEKIVNFTTDESFPSRLLLGKVKGRLGIKAELKRMRNTRESVSPD